MSANNSTQQEECDSASLESLLTCTTKGGALCVYEDNSTRPYTCTITGGIGLGNSHGSITCAYFIPYSINTKCISDMLVCIIQ